MNAMKPNVPPSPRFVPPCRLALFVCFIFLVAPLALATTTHYVVKDNPGAASPYLSWETAAPDIQSAIGVVPSGGSVVVADGIYDAGTLLPDDGTPSRIVVPEDVVVRSSNGPGFARIQGGSGIRCATLVGSGRLVGFGLFGAENVGAIVGEGAQASVENCQIFSNSAVRGGGARGVSMTNCWLWDNVASLDGGAAFDCALANCRLFGNRAENGGGTSASVLRDCVVTSNSASGFGGGAHGSSLYGCVVVFNDANRGGGTAESDLFNCTLFANSAAYSPGGALGGTLVNGIVHANLLSDASPSDWLDTTMLHCLSSPLAPGDGNLSGDPLMVDPYSGDFRLLENSPCRNAGTNQPWMDDSLDAAGSPRIAEDVVDLGAFEFTPPPVPSPLLDVLGIDGLSIAYDDPPSVASGTIWTTRTGHASTRSFAMANAGNVPLNVAGFSVSGPGSNAFSVLAMPLQVEPGQSLTFSIVFQPSQSLQYDAALLVEHSASNAPSPFTIHLLGVGVPPTDRFVVLGNPFAVSPYTNWAEAAADIQSAISVCLPDDTVWVSNGICDSGSVGGLGDVLHRIAITNPVAVRSVNGPSSAVIRGEEGIRCAFLGNNASLVGFTLTNGLDAGGAWCIDKTAMLSNCVVAGNSASVGGGVLDGTVRNCLLAGNSADSGGASFNANLWNCDLIDNLAELGGGAFDGELNGCTLRNNIATESGGGAFGAILRNCDLSNNVAQGASGGGGAAESTLYGSVFFGNSASLGGGARDCFLRNCTVVGNSAATAGGGVHGGSAINSIVYFNLQGEVEDNALAASMSYCCSIPLLPGDGNLDSDPHFVDALTGNFRLSSSSPCINAGFTETWMSGSLDLDGNFRDVGPSVDMGAYEHPFTPMGIDASWLADNGLPWDGSADLADADSDDFSNWAEWRAGTDPNDPSSRLAFDRPDSIAPPDGIGRILKWKSVAGKAYSIERSTHLPGESSFLPLATGVEGQFGHTAYTDRLATVSGIHFYRILIP